MFLTIRFAYNLSPLFYSGKDGKKIMQTNYIFVIFGIIFVRHMIYMLKINFQF